MQESIEDPHDTENVIIPNMKDCFNNCLISEIRAFSLSRSAYVQSYFWYL